MRGIIRGVGFSDECQAAAPGPGRRPAASPVTAVAATGRHPGARAGVLSRLGPAGTPSHSCRNFFGAGVMPTHSSSSTGGPVGPVTVTVAAAVTRIGDFRAAADPAALRRRPVRVGIGKSCLPLAAGGPCHGKSAAGRSRLAWARQTRNGLLASMQCRIHFAGYWIPIE